MSKKEFDEWLDKLTHLETMIVRIRYKYSYETKWTYRNEILSPEMYPTLSWVWENDWWEGQEDVEILGYIFLSDVEVNKYGRRIK